MGIEPWNGESGIAMCPRVSNIPVGREGWEKATCPECGEECWMQPSLKELLPTGKLIPMCTMCAMKYAVHPAKK